MIFLQSVELRRRESMGEGYPFSLPLVQRFAGMHFTAPVTFFVGENGAGKSTLLEAIATAAGAITVGGEDLDRDDTLAQSRRLASHLTLSWRQRIRRGFFMRAEDFFNFASRTTKLVRELEEEAVAFEQEMTGDGLRRAQASIRGQRAALERAYGGDLHARSHGEGFMQVFQARFQPGGLYLLDEPDTALSPQRQLALLAMLKDMVAQEAQFIIATHSPVLLALPGSTILTFDGETIRDTPYDEVENVVLTRRFLANPGAYLRHL